MRPVIAVDESSTSLPALHADWMKRLQAGDKAAFESLFHAYYDSLCGFAKAYLGGRDAAEEVVQEVFIRLWEQRARLVIRQGIKAYLFGAVRNRSLNGIGHRRVHQMWAAQVGEDPVALAIGLRPQPADASAEESDLVAAVQRAMMQLPARRREACLLRWQRSLTNAEVAEVMGISIKGVEMALAKGLKQLRESLRPLLADTRP